MQRDLRSLAAVVGAGLSALHAGGAASHAPEAMAGELAFSLELALDRDSTRVICEHGDEQEVSDDELAVEGDGVSVEWEAEWRDEDRSISGLQLPGFSGTYERLALHVEAARLDSPLEGVPLRWVWNETGKGYDCSVMAEDTVERGTLESLGSDLSFSWVFPGGTIPGPQESWQLEANDLVEAIWPGGFGPLPPKREPKWPMVHIAVVPDFPADSLFWNASAQGSVTARLDELERTEAGEVAVVALQFDVAVPSDTAAWLDRAFAGDEEIPGDYLEMLEYGGDGLEWSLEGGGQVRWSIQGKHVLAVDLTAEVEVRSHLAWSYHWDAPRIEEFSGERSETWTGRLELSGRAWPEKTR